MPIKHPESMSSPAWKRFHEHELPIVKLDSRLHESDMVAGTYLKMT
jgi:hypothetical protein